MVTKRKVDKEIPQPPSIKLRDYFAALAMQGIIGRGSLDTDMNVTPYCLDAYTIADAMIEASSSPATAKAPATTSKRIHTKNEALLAEARQLQHDLWDKLYELEEALDIEIDANTDLEGESIESLKEIDALL